MSRRRSRGRLAGLGLLAATLVVGAAAASNLIGSSSPTTEPIPAPESPIPSAGDIASPVLSSGLACDPVADEVVVTFHGLNFRSMITVQLGPGAYPAPQPLDVIDAVAGGTYQVIVSWVDPLARTPPPIDSFDARVQLADGTTAPVTTSLASNGAVQVTLPQGSGTTRFDFHVALTMSPCEPLGGSGSFNLTLVPGPPADAVAVPSFPVVRYLNDIPYGCDAIGVGNTVSGTLRGDPADPELVWLVGGDGKRLSIVWPEGFTVAFRPNAVLFNEAGVEVGRDGGMIKLSQVPVTSAAGTTADPYYASRILFGGCYPRQADAPIPAIAPSATPLPDLAGCPVGETGFWALVPGLDRTIRVGGVSVPLVTSGIGLRSGTYWADDAVGSWAGFDPRRPLTVRVTPDGLFNELEITGSLGMELTAGWTRRFWPNDYNLAGGELPDLGSQVAQPLDSRDGRLVGTFPSGRYLIAISVRWQTACLAGDGTAYLLLDVAYP